MICSKVCKSKSQPVFCVVCRDEKKDAVQCAAHCIETHVCSECLLGLNETGQINKCPVCRREDWIKNKTCLTKVYPHRISTVQPTAQFSIEVVSIVRNNQIYSSTPYIDSYVNSTPYRPTYARSTNQVVMPGAENGDTEQTVCCKCGMNIICAIRKIKDYVCMAMIILMYLMCVFLAGLFTFLIIYSPDSVNEMKITNVLLYSLLIGWTESCIIFMCTKIVIIIFIPNPLRPFVMPVIQL